MQLPANLNFVVVRPVGYLVQANLADSKPSHFVDCRARPEAVFAPLAQGVLEHTHHSLTAEWAAAADVAHHLRIGVQAEQVIEIILTPGSKNEASGFDRAHATSLAAEYVAASCSRSDLGNLVPGLRQGDYRNKRPSG